MGKEVFIPGCKAVEGKDGFYDCTPKLLTDGKAFASESPVRVKISERGTVFIDDGGSPEIILRKLAEWLDKEKIAR